MLAMEDKVFTFDELSGEAKETAREWMRGHEMTDFDAELLCEDFEQIANIFGISWDDPSRDIRWSGFRSQGDGASFVGRYTYAPTASAKIREHAPEDESLHKIADGLTALQVGCRLTNGHFLEAIIHQQGRYVHEYTMDVDVSHAETGESLENWNGDKELLDLFRDFARWIYRALENEWDYRLSDECIDGHLSEYEFDEDGIKV